MRVGVVVVWGLLSVSTASSLAGQQDSGGGPRRDTLTPCAQAFQLRVRLAVDEEAPMPNRPLTLDAGGSALMTTNGCDAGSGATAGDVPKSRWEITDPQGASVAVPTGAPLSRTFTPTRVGPYVVRFTGSYGGCQFTSVGRGSDGKPRLRIVTIAAKVATVSIDVGAPVQLSPFTAIACLPPVEIK